MQPKSISGGSLGVCSSLVLGLGLLLPVQGPAQTQQKSAREDLRLGGVQATEATAFITEPTLVVDASNRVYARTDHDVRVFQKDGSHQITLGREGEGPAEFTYVAAHGILGDTVWLWNFRPSRIAFFLLDGRNVGTQTFEAPSALGDSMDVRVISLLMDGRVLARGDYPFVIRRSMEGRYRAPLLTTTRDLSNRVTIGSILTPDGLFVPGVAEFMFRPFPPSPLFSPFPNGSGIVVGSWEKEHPGVLRVEIYDPFGERVREKALVAPTGTVPDDLADDLVEEALGLVTPVAERAARAGARVPSDLEKAVRTGLMIPEMFPPFQEVVAGIDGSIWLHRMRSPEDSLWLVLDKDAKVAYSVELPAGIKVQQASMSNVWATALGEFDTPLILRFAIEG